MKKILWFLQNIWLTVVFNIQMKATIDCIEKE